MAGGRPRKNKSIARAFARLDRILMNLEGSADDGSDLAELQRFVESLQIVTKTRGQQSLIFNRSQENVWHQLLEAREKQSPGRFICLKSRQLGISTLIEAFLFALALRRANKVAMVVAHDWRASMALFKMTKFFHDNLPDSERLLRPLLSSTHQQLIFSAPHNSIFKVSTAAPTLGRGGTLHYVHRSEVAFWDNAEEASAAVAQCIPLDWDTFDFWESTAFGYQNLFAETWRAAVSGESGYIPIFLTWKGFPDYFLPTGTPSYSPEDLRYKTEYNLSDGEATWAQQKRRDGCNNSWEIFHAEYPIVPELAFQYSGRPWFDPEEITATLERITVAPPAQRGRLIWQPDTDAPIVVWVDDETGLFEVWEEPQPLAKYVLGGDVGEGVGAAFTVLTVLKRPQRIGDPMVQVAKFRSNRIKPEHAGEVAFQLGCWYNWAYLGIECNNHGHSTLSALTQESGFVPQMRMGYTDLYYHVRRDQKTQEETRKKGWATDKVTRPILFNRLKLVTDDILLVINSKATALEMQGIAYDPNRGDAGLWRQTYKNPETKIYNDDEIFSIGIAVQLAEHIRAGGAIAQMRDGG